MRRKILELVQTAFDYLRSDPDTLLVLDNLNDPGFSISLLRESQLLSVCPAACCSPPAAGTCADCAPLRWICWGSRCVETVVAPDVWQFWKAPILNIPWQ